MPARISVCLLIALFSATAESAVIAGKVVGVADGDTITILDARNKQYKIRIAGIDAPERAQPFGQRSKEKMSDLVYGRQVSVEWNKRDRYQRIVGKVIAGNQDAGLSLISAGLAWHFKMYEREQTSADRSAYADAEDRAKAKRIGVWGDPGSVPPWKWRAAKRGN